MLPLRPLALGTAGGVPFQCVQGINPNQTVGTDPGLYFSPVAFSFFKNPSMYSMVFCYTTSVEHNVVAKLALNADDINDQVINSVSDQGVVGSLGWGLNG